MSYRHTIELALDLTRMPALARSSIEPPIPPDIIELMRIAAASPKACQEAAAATGERTETLIEAARFYLRQSLFRPEADCHRILGLRPNASRALARSHMRWLMQWLHPDRNSDLDAVYAERVLKAWHEISISSGATASTRTVRNTFNGTSASVRLPWIKIPLKRGRHGALKRTFVAWVLSAGLIIVFLLVGSAVYYLGLDQMTAMSRAR